MVADVAESGSDSNDIQEVPIVMSRHILSIVLLYSVFGALSIFAQWVPIIAKTRTIQEKTSSEDGTTEVRRLEGRFLRWSDGSELITRAETVNGAPVREVRATLVDSGRGLIVEANLTTKVAVIKEEFSPPRLQHPQKPSDRPRSLVNGLECISIPIRGPFISAQGWYSKQYDIIVKQEILRKHNKYTIKYIEEVYDIRVGDAPSAGDKPDLARFAVERSQSVTLPSCGTCSTSDRLKR